MDVTEQGLGEAARRLLAGTSAGVFSVTGSRLRFDHSPLLVQQGLAEEPLASAAVANQWTVAGLEQAIAQSEGEPKNWAEVMRRVQERFTGLVFSAAIVEDLIPHPFSRCVAQRIVELLAVLEQLVAQSDDDGRLSGEGERIRNMHFVGESTWFSSESKSNKSDFEQDLKFPDPSNPGKKISCPWHAKIQTPQFRIHFEWPRPAGQCEIKVVYIGPKITKR